MRDPGSPGPMFRAGDRVQYWEHGPVMHVISASTHLCHCNWIDDSGLLQQGTFEQRNLRRAPPPDAGASPLG